MRYMESKSSPEVVLGEIHVSVRAKRVNLVSISKIRQNSVMKMVGKRTNLMPLATAVLPRNSIPSPHQRNPLPRYYRNVSLHPRGYRGNTAVPIPVQLSNVQ